MAQMDDAMTKRRPSDTAFISTTPSRPTMSRSIVQRSIVASWVMAIGVARRTSFAASARNGLDIGETYRGEFANARVGSRRTEGEDMKKAFRSVAAGSLGTLPVLILALTSPLAAADTVVELGGVHGSSFVPRDVTVLVGDRVDWHRLSGFHNVAADDQ